MLAFITVAVIANVGISLKDYVLNINTNIRQIIVHTSKRFKSYDLTNIIFKCMTTTYLTSEIWEVLIV